jgi:16S rRNA (adenine1518-N6/adenine1519-N6)-dimethyltransferase
MFYQKSKAVLRQQGLAASKKLGQNFLVHRHTAEHIADLAGLSKADTVVEVGVGLGARIPALSVFTRQSRICPPTFACCIRMC